MAKTLYEYYSSKGQKLPSVSERAPLAAQYGIQNYTGTAEQNNLLLSKLESTGAAPVPPAGAPVEQRAAAPVGTGPAFAPSPGTEQAGDLGNLRIALREALNEAARKRVENNFKLLAPLGSGAAPGTIGSVVDLIRGGIKPAVETTFSDIMAGYKDATEAKQKEIDRINQLRLEYGSAIPSNITDLQAAIDLVTPLVDADRKRAIDKMAKDQAEDNDIQSWAESYAKGEVSIGNVPAAIRTQVKVAADKIRLQLESDAKSEYKERIAFRLEKKTSDFEQERTLVLQDDNLNVAEQREVLDYIDGLESAQKASKAKGGKGFFSFLNPANAPAPAPAPANFTPANRQPLFGPTAPGAQSPAGALKPFDDAFVKPFRDFLNAPR